MSGLLGFTGMVFGVPIFAVMYAFIKNGVENKLRAKGMPESTSEYYTTEAGKQLCRERAEADARHSRKFSETKLGSKIVGIFAKKRKNKAEAEETEPVDDNIAETAASAEISDDSEKSI